MSVKVVVKNGATYGDTAMISELEIIFCVPIEEAKLSQHARTTMRSLRLPGREQ